MREEKQTLLRSWRISLGHSLGRVCELFEQRGFEKPSTAKLSRIERDQNVPLEMIPEIEAITGIPAEKLRPDIAKIFSKKSSEAAQ